MTSRNDLNICKYRLAKSYGTEFEKKKFEKTICNEIAPGDKAVMVTSDDIDKMALLEIEDLKRVIAQSAEREKQYIRNIREQEE